MVECVLILLAVSFSTLCDLKLIEVTQQGLPYKAFTNESERSAGSQVSVIFTTEKGNRQSSLWYRKYKHLLHDAKIPHLKAEYRNGCWTVMWVCLAVFKTERETILS